MNAAFKSRIAQYAALVALLLAPGAASYAGIASNTHVDPCINITVLDGHSNNVCITSNAAISVSDITVGTTQSGGVFVGPGAGVLALDGGSRLFVSNSLSVGSSAGNGTLTIQGGATVSSGSNGAFIGSFSGTGIATVDGTGSALNSTGLISVGSSNGNGTLTIQGGATVSSGSNGAFIGSFSGTGIATVDGTGSALNSTGSISVGSSNGNGTLTIQNGGTVSGGSDVNGNGGGIGNGATTVSGSGSALNSTGSIFVGSSGANGMLTIQNGGIVSSGSNVAGNGLFIGSVASGTGTATVSGTGSSLNSTGAIIVGSSTGNGTLTLQNGATIDSGKDVNGNGAFIGSFSGTGIATVTASTWNTAGAIVVGSSNGNGTLTIQNGAIVTGGRDVNDVGAYIGSFSGTGSVTVTGASSTWNSAGAISVGSSGGTGTLTIQDGAIVTAARDLGNGIGAYVGSFSGNGTVTVSGPGSTWNTGVNLVVGSTGGQGTVTVDNGGFGHSAELVLGADTGSSGMLTLAGRGTAWDNDFITVIGERGSGRMIVTNGAVFTNVPDPDVVVGVIVGSTGNGTLSVTQGGKVTAPFLQLGENAGSLGSLVVADLGSTVHLTGSLITGNGMGEISIANRGRLEIDRNIVVDSARISVSGGSEISSSGFLGLQLGSAKDDGSGSLGVLTISSGSAVNATQASIGAGGFGTEGRVSVDGVGSLLRVDGELDIGTDEAKGSLTLSNHASVEAAEILIGPDGTVRVVDTTSTLTGSVTNHGSLILDPSTLNILGDFTQASDGLLILDIAGLSSDLFSQLNISGFGIFNGIIDFEFINGFAPHAGDHFDLITALGGADFSLASFQILGLQPGLDYSDTFNDGRFTLTALNDGVSTTAAPEPGTLLLLGLALVAMMAVSMQQPRFASHPRRRWCVSY
jgi:T5SS/PEP-CTERM-associated repeat protein